MKKAFTLLFTLITLLGVLAAAIPIVASAADETVDPYADYSKWDGQTYDLTPFEGITPDNGGNNCVLPDGVDAIIIDSAAKLAGLSKAVNEAGITGSYGAFKGVPIYVTVNIDLCGYEFRALGYDYAKAMFSGMGVT